MDRAEVYGENVGQELYYPPVCSYLDLLRLGRLHAVQMPALHSQPPSLVHRMPEEVTKPFTQSNTI